MQNVWYGNGRGEERGGSSTSSSGAWNLPYFSNISCRFAEPREVLRNKWGISSSTRRSRTTRQNGDGSYAHSTTGSSGSVDGLYRPPLPILHDNKLRRAEPGALARTWVLMLMPCRAWQVWLVAKLWGRALFVGVHAFMH